MKGKIFHILQDALGKDLPIELSVPEEPSFGHYSTNVAMRVASARGRSASDGKATLAKKPLDFAQEFAAEIRKKSPAGFFEKVEAAAPGFVNFWLSKETVQEALEEIVGNEQYGRGNEMKGKLVMVEFTDANPFKLFHIGHLMSNTIGESFARVYEAMGAKVRRANYYGDVGLHIAKTILGMMVLKKTRPADDASLIEKMNYLGNCYSWGSGHRSLETEEDHQNHKITDELIDAGELQKINKKIYERSDAETNKLYDSGLAWSLAYFETVYQRLGTKFDDYFPESVVAGEGLEFVRSRMDIFKESDGAVIFPGEEYGLHIRVFINSQGLPTYEAKELGLNKKKFELYPLNLSVIVTGNEIVDYFKVLMKAMELTLPEVAAKTRHAPHGMLRLPSGKMSSRTGDVITAEALLDQIKMKLRERVSDRADDLSPAEREAATEAIAVGAIKYSILKQSPGQDIVFDFEKSLAVEGDSGPYVQYAYARLKSILRKANCQLAIANCQFTFLDSEPELSLMRKIFEFPDVVTRAGQSLSASGLASYIHKLAVAANKFYETTPILKDENESRRNARLALVAVSARTLKVGLELLGIKTLEKI